MITGWPTFYNKALLVALCLHFARQRPFHTSHKAARIYHENLLFQQKHFARLRGNIRFFTVLRHTT